MIEIATMGTYMGWRIEKLAKLFDRYVAGLENRKFDGKHLRLSLLERNGEPVKVKFVEGSRFKVLLWKLLHFLYGSVS